MKTAAPPLPGWLAVLRQRLFATWLDTVVSLLCLYVVWRVSVPLVQWLLIEANWNGASREDCTSSGACWVFIRARFAQFMYGQYPVPERWRVDLLGLLALFAGAALSWRGLPRRRELAIATAIILPPLGIWLLYGGFGLKIVETREWGGLMLTLFLAIYAGLIAVPLGILLALGRRSRLPLIRFASIVFIEFWRGVPIITVIFLASQLLPLILPNGVDVNKLVRALVGLALVVAAYMAEVVRGGLAALPKGQYEAADALGLNYWQATRLIVLPQALRTSIPGLVNEFIALLKNTTLVLIVSLFDLLGIVQAALADPKWVGLTHEGYLFAGFTFWIICFGLSRWSLNLENRLGLGKR